MEGALATHLYKPSSRVDSPDGNDSAGDILSEAQPVFWPGDLLPEVCPMARILVYGYDARVTHFMPAAPNKSNIFSHSKDLLLALARERALDRPLVLVAHSLGGIVVKEVFALAPWLLGQLATRH